VRYLKRSFNCRCVDFFRKTRPGKYRMYESHEFREVQGTAGAASFVLDDQVPMNIREVTKGPHYSQQIDGIAAETVLAVSLDAETAIVLRGSRARRCSVPATSCR
jgi:hypothetical protein